MVGGVVVLILVVVILVGSAIWSIFQARNALNQAKSDISQITADPHQLLSVHARLHAAALAAQVEADVAKAHGDLDDSPGFTAMWAVPYLHTQRQATLQLLDDMGSTAATGRTLVTTTDALVSQSHGTSVSLPRLQALHRQVAAAAARQKAMEHHAGSLFPPLATAWNSFEHLNTHIADLLAQGSQLTQYAQVFLGGEGNRTYFLAAENNAEIRDQGMILSYAIIHTDNGSYQVDSPSSIGNLNFNGTVSTPLPAGTAQVFGFYDPNRFLRQVNATADFQWTGQAIQEMYADSTGQHVDGVVALDVPGLARILKVTGPVHVAGVKGPITSANLAETALHKLYQGETVGSPTARRDILADVAKAAVDKIHEGHVDLAAFVNALANDVAGRHLLAWDDVPANEATIRRFGASGAIDNDDPSRAFHLSVETDTATKLDYYTTVSSDVKINLTRYNNAVITTTVNVANHAPKNAKPSYQLGPDNVVSFSPGQYVGTAFLWAPRGSIQPGSVPESGLQVLAQNLSVGPHSTTQVVYQTVIPDAVQHGRLKLVYVPQPRLRPEQVSLHLNVQGWTLQGPADQHLSLTRTRAATWSIHR